MNMDNKNSVIRLTGKVQHYQWGGFNYIPALLGIENKDQRPFAEFWLGAHTNAPSQLDGGLPLDEFIRQHPDVLGESVSKKFGRLPYLLKILDVKDMLSIQVHPTKKAAEIEFAAENKKGIALDATNRNYKDDNHKPELMTALSDFWLLHGFQDGPLLSQTISQVPEFAFMQPVFERSGYKGLYELLMTMDQAKINELLQPVLDRVIPLYKANELPKSSPDFWAARAALTFNQGKNIDRGIFSIYLLNIVHLKKGEAVFQDAGILHAYLEGQNVEIMANSDNVLRGGLTPKHIDVAELIKHVQFEAVIPAVIYGSALNKSEEVFRTPAPDFELSKIMIEGGMTYNRLSASADIFLVLSGSVEVAGEAFKKGEAFLAEDKTLVTMQAITSAEVYRAGVPVNAGAMEA